MEADDDDLSALRSAALASLSKKEQKVEPKEEDLTALRQAALMTRKQKQIEVIRLPLPQSNEFPNWLDPPLRLSVHIPISGIPPPPHNVNMNVIRPVNIMPPAPFMPQRPPPSIPRPPTSWAITNLINLTPGPAPRVHPPLMGNLRQPRFMNIPPRQFPSPRSVPPQRGPLNQNLIVHRQARFSGPRNRPQRAVRPVQQMVVKTKTVSPVNVNQNTSEQKVSDKFSRYDPDSSSDEEDDDHTQESQKNESDAESVASNKSFRSVSEAADNDIQNDEDEDEPEKSSEDEEENQTGDDTPVVEEHISIDNEEDGILAAIDEFLDEGLDLLPTPKEVKKPAKTAPSVKKTKLTASSMSTKKKQSSKTSEKPSKIEFAKPVSETKNVKSKEDIVKRSSKSIKPITAPTPIKTPKAGVKSVDTVSNKCKPEPVKAIRKANAGKISSSKISGKKQISPTDVANPERLKSRPQRSDLSKIQGPIRAKRDSQNSVTAAPNFTARQSTQQIQDSERLRQKELQPRQKVGVTWPDTEPRQRRDSDLDSVGSSDLSFLSSSESETESKKPSSLTTRKSDNLNIKPVQKGEKLQERQRTDAPERVKKIGLKQRIGLKASDVSVVEKHRPLGGVKERVGVHERNSAKHRLDSRAAAEAEEKQSKDFEADSRKTKSKSIDLRQKLKRDTPERKEVKTPKSGDLREKIKWRKNAAPEDIEENRKRPVKAKKPSPVSVRSDRVQTAEKSAIIKLNSDSKSRNFLSQGRNIVITKRRTPSPISGRTSTSPEPVKVQNVKKPERTRKRSISTRSMDEKVKKIVKPMPDVKTESTVRVKSRKSYGKSSDSVESIKHDIVDSSKVKPRKLSTKRDKVQRQTSRQLAPSESSENEPDVNEIDILDIHEYDDMLFDIEGNFELEAPQKTTPKEIKPASNMRSRKQSASSQSDSESDGEIIEEPPPEPKYVRKPTLAKASDQRRKPIEMDSDSDGEIIEEYQQPTERKGSKKLLLSRKSDMKKTPEFRRKPVKTEHFTDGESDGEINKTTKFKQRHKAEFRQTVDRKKRARKSPEMEELENRYSRSRIESSGKDRRVLISTESKKRGLKRKSPDFDSDKPPKKSLKGRLGSRVVVKDDEFVEEYRRQSNDSESDSDRRTAPKVRKVVKTKRKKTSSSKDDRLEARIERIKKQNGRILQRQMEIEHEKKRFG